MALDQQERDMEDEDDDYDPFAEVPTASVKAALPKAAAAKEASHIATTGKAAMVGAVPKAPTSEGAQPKAPGGAMPKAAVLSAPLAGKVVPPPAVPLPAPASPGTQDGEPRPKSATNKASTIALASASAKLGSGLAKSAGAGPVECPPGPPPGPAPAQGLGTEPPAPPPDFSLAAAKAVPVPGLPLPLPLPAAPPALGSDLAGVGAALPLPPLPLMLPLPPGLPAISGLPAALPVPQVFWDEHKSPTGAPYFYCKATGESRWVRPAGPQDVVVDPSAPGAAAVAAAPAAAPAKAGTAAIDIKAQLGEPESWESIGKTGWLRVETDKGFKYFFHKKKKKTAWTCPEEIAKEVAELDGVLGVTAPEAPAADEAPAAAANPDEGEAPAAKEATKEAEVEPARPSKAERAEAHRKKVEEEQKVSKEKQRLLNFKALLLEKGVKGFDKYEKWMPKLIYDPRFTAVPLAERKALFTAYAKRIDGDRQKLAAEQKRGNRGGFLALIEEARKKNMLQGRKAAEAVEFLERKFGDDPRWRGVSEREREKVIKDLAQEVAERQKKEKDEARLGFRALVTEKIRELKEKNPPPFHKIEKILRQDPRWAPVECTADRERFYGQVIREMEEAQKEKKRRHRADVEDIEAARKKRRDENAEEGLLSLLAERVKAPYATTWDEVREALADLPQFRDNALSEDGQQRVFDDYRQSIINLRAKEFSSFLAGLPADAIGPEMSFEEVIDRVSTLPVAKAFEGVPEGALQQAWLDWQDSAHDRALQVCRTWLRSSGDLIGVEGVEPDTPEFDALLQKLCQADVRFRRLGARPEEQRKLLTERLRELQGLRAQGRSGMEEDVG